MNTKQLFAQLVCLSSSSVVLFAKEYELLALPSKRIILGGKKMYIDDVMSGEQLSVMLLLLFLTSVIILGILYVKAGSHRPRSNTL